VVVVVVVVAAAVVVSYDEEVANGYAFKAWERE